MSIPTFMDIHGRGMFYNVTGYKLQKIRDDKYLWWLTRAIYSYAADAKNPLTWMFHDGWRLRPNKYVQETDMGSIPLSVQPVIPKDRFLLTWIVHDSGYRDGGLFVCEPGGDYFVFHKMSRLEIDQFMREGIRSEGGNTVIQNAVYWSVRVVSWFAWNRYRAQDARRDTQRGRSLRP